MPSAGFTADLVAWQGGLTYPWPLHMQGIRDDLQSTRRVLRDELQCVQKAQDVISAAVKADAAS